MKSKVLMFLCFCMLLISITTVSILANSEPTGDEDEDARNCYAYFQSRYPTRPESSLLSKLKNEACMEGCNYAVNYPQN